MIQWLVAAGEKKRIPEKMKKVSLIGISLVAMGVAPAFAADLPARAPVYTKAPVVAPVYNWSGFYIGLNAGGASSHNCWDLTANFLQGAVPPTSVGCHDATGALVGGQIGYRWQMTNWVFGLEAQGDWANLKGSNISTLGTFAGQPFLNQTKIDSLGLFTGQIGYAWNNVLLYAKGGAAVTHDNYAGISQIAVVALPANAAFDQAHDTRWGGAIGTGLEFRFAPNWSIAVEYDHLFMGSSSANLINFQGGYDRTQSIKQNVDMGTVRVNYSFGGPVVAKY
jgi:outer membrane immunogenic protein